MTDILKNAQAAKQILRVEELDAFGLIRENLKTKWELSPLSDKKGRNDRYLMLHALNELNRYLRKLVDDGKIEELKKEPKR